MARTRPPVIFKVPKDSTGFLLKATLKQDGVALDVSSGSGVLFHAKKLNSDGSYTSTINNGTAAFTDDGSDGQVEFQLTAALVGTEGTYKAEFEITGYAGGQLVSELFEIRVLPRAKISA